MPTYNYIIAVFLCFYTCYPNGDFEPGPVSVLAMAMQLRSLPADKHYRSTDTLKTNM